MNLRFETRVQGLWKEEGLVDQVEMLGGSTNDLTAPLQTLATIKLRTPILKLTVGTSPDPDGWAVTPMLRVDGEEIPLLAAFNHIGREVAWAISHVTGLTKDAQVAPAHFDL
jgi:hypothetical protein